MLKATLVSSTITLDLDEITQAGAGTQLIAGALGFGLPPVDVQWTEGAGDGATYRSTRVLPRDVDLPIHITAPNRAALKTKIRTLSKVLSGMVQVFLTETSDNTYVYADFYRTGGGLYTYGGTSDQSTIGETEFETVVTLRAGNPYWLYQDVTTSVTTGTSQTTKNLNNIGTADAIPTFKLTGPAAGVELTGPDGSKFSWTGTLLSGATLTIDPNKGTVTDNLGNNRYAGLSYAPKFWRIPPDFSTATVKIVPRTPGTRKNYVTNPTFGANATTGWSSTVNAALSASNGTLRISGGGTSAVPQASTTITGLTAGNSYQLRLRYRVVSASPSYSNGRLKLTNGASSFTKDILPVLSATGSFEDWVIDEFVAEGTTATISVVTPYKLLGSAYYNIPVEMDNVFVGQAGPYFDGSTAATTSETFAWDGTANASTSTATEVLTGGQPTLTIEWRPRDWMVV